MGLTLAKCPACGAELNLETNSDYFYCPHCGSKVLKQDNRIIIEHVTRTVDEAEVKKAEVKKSKIETKAEIKLQKIEKEASKQKLEAEKMKWFAPALSAYGVIAALVFKAPPIVIIAIAVIAGITTYHALKQNNK